MSLSLLKLKPDFVSSILSFFFNHQAIEVLQFFDVSTEDQHMRGMLFLFVSKTSIAVSFSKMPLKLIMNRIIKAPLTSLIFEGIKRRNLAEEFVQF
jgi:hypothetical protein